ncbi:MAG: T9SS type A sorting domain-containing protein [Kordia sp.]|uniref:T9SS type A sorting domain-containing protein n=1 Tax=Kordia sp. TaxID=1965332 RepID=UPI00385857D0
MLDFNTDPFSDGSTGFVNFTTTNGVTTIEIDFVMNDGKELTGMHMGDFPIDPILSVENFSKTTKQPIKLLSNPVEDVLRFEVLEHKNERYNFYLFNSSGMLVLEISSKKKYQNIVVDNLSAGIYFLQFSNQKEKVTKKIIIQ